MTIFGSKKQKQLGPARFYSTWYAWYANYMVMSPLLPAWQSIHHTKFSSSPEPHAAKDPIFIHFVPPVLFTNHVDPLVYFEA